MKNLMLTVIFVCSIILAQAQYTTPGTGVNWNLDDLVSNSGGVVTLEASGQYIIHQDITISIDDTISIVTSEEINVADDVLFTVQGIMITDPQALGIVFFKALDNYYKGFRFEDSHGSDLSLTYFKKAGGIKLVNSDMRFTSCDFSEFNQGYSTGTVNLYQSSPLIDHCDFSSNDGPAIMSGANSSSSPQILSCDIYSNVAANGNTPQINLGTSGADSIRIINCWIVGSTQNTMAGGIAITTLAGGSAKALIEWSEIIDNRYGITCYGSNIGTVIRHNGIFNNNTQNQPMQGGSGINFFGDESNQSLVSLNYIVGNLWGITIQGNAQPNLGQLEGNIYNPGFNSFMNNGNEGEDYDLYNNTPNTIMAQNNYWGTADPDLVEDHIFHQVDDPSLGFVEYLPFLTQSVGIEEKSNLNNETNIAVYPNPAKAYFFIETKKQEFNKYSFLNVDIFNVSGKLIKRTHLTGNKNLYKIDLPENYAGMAIVKISSGDYTVTKKLFVGR